MNGTSLKFRDDLAITRREADGKVSYVVKDPLTDKYFYFGEAERFIASQLNGRTSPLQIREEAERSFGAALSVEMLDSFIANCEKAGLLEREGTKKKTTKRSGRRIGGNLLYLRFKIFDPDRLFNRLVPRLRFLFTPYFVAFSGAAILTGVLTLIANWSTFTGDLSTLRYSSIPLFMLVTFLVVSLHEFAHGLTCKHFGGEVHEIGFMLIYFQPALYCNVSDAWLFREKSKRLLVGFAGPYFELFIWSLATLAWRITAEETWINFVALIVMTGSGIKTLLNFNPFIKLDGYYLLSDYLEIPNLRKKAFRYVGKLMEQFFDRKPETAERLSDRERMAFFLYGTVALAGSFSLLGYILFSAGGYLVDGHVGPLAILATAGLVVSKFRRRLRRLFGTSSGGADPEDDGALGSTPGSDNGEDGKKEGRRKRSARLSGRRLMWAGVAGAVLLFALFGKTQLRVSGPFNILPVHNADVRPEIDGLIEEIYVSEGDTVEKGDLLARLSDREYRNEMQKTAEEIQQTQAKLRMLEAGPRKEEIHLAKTAVDKSAEHLNYARVRLSRDKAMLEKDLLSQKEFEETHELASIAEKDLAEAQGRLNLLRSGARREEIDVMGAELARLRSQHQYLEGQLQRVEVRSPAGGVVATPERQLRGMLRQVVQKGALIAKVFELKKLTVEIVIPEKEFADIKVGQTVALKARAYPDETFNGVVSSIATAAQTESPGSANTIKSISITTEIENNFPLLKPEMTGHAKIFCGERRIYEVMLRQLSHIVKVEFWSWW